jgi:hypothetical protein
MGVKKKGENKRFRGIKVKEQGRKRKTFWYGAQIKNK